MTNSTWSKEKEEYVNKLCRNCKKIWFFSLGSEGHGTLRWDTENNQEYDLIMGYNVHHDFYVVLKAENHREQKNIKMKKALENVDVKCLREIEITEQKSPAYGTEKVAIISYIKLEDFCKNLLKWLKKLE